MGNYNTPATECGCNNASARPMPYAQQRPSSMRQPMSRSCNMNMKQDALSNMPVAMAYVPWQFFQEVYEPDKALQYGTIFPELNKPFYGKGGCPR